MSYPAVTVTDAKAYIAAMRIGDDPTHPPVHNVALGVDVPWEEMATSLSGELSRLQLSVGQDGSTPTSKQFDALAAPIVHRLLPEHEALSDPKFWVWLACSHLREVIESRYGHDCDLQNFGIGSAGENFAFRMWLRAEVSYQPERDDPYALSQHGDVDFWRSHVFRQSYGEARQFVRALITYQFATEGGKPRLKIADIRKLVKSLRKARTNIFFELMDEARARTFIEHEWDKLVRT